jgi:hypothetical protein
MQAVRFGTSSEFVCLVFPSRPIPEGWIDAQVDITVQSFHGLIRPSLEVFDLEQFLTQLSKLHSSLKGSAELRPREKQFVLSIKADAMGHMLLSGTAWSNATYGNRLEFELELDQTYLDEPISQLRSVLNAWGQNA